MWQNTSVHTLNQISQFFEKDFILVTDKQFGSQTTLTNNIDQLSAE